MSGLRQFTIEATMLSEQASSTGLLSATRCPFPLKNAYQRVQRSPEPLRVVFARAQLSLQRTPTVVQQECPTDDHDAKGGDVRDG